MVDQSETEEGQDLPIPGAIDWVAYIFMLYVLFSWTSVRMLQFACLYVLHQPLQFALLTLSPDSKLNALYRVHRRTCAMLCELLKNVLLSSKTIRFPAESSSSQSQKSQTGVLPREQEDRKVESAKPEEKGANTVEALGDTKKPNIQDASTSPTPVTSVLEETLVSTLRRFFSRLE